MTDNKDNHNPMQDAESNRMTRDPSPKVESQTPNNGILPDDQGKQRKQLDSDKSVDEQGPRGSTYKNVDISLEKRPSGGYSFTGNSLPSNPNMVSGMPNDKLGTVPPRNADVYAEDAVHAGISDIRNTIGHLQETTREPNVQTKETLLNLAKLGVNFNVESSHSVIGGKSGHVTTMTALRVDKMENTGPGNIESGYHVQAKAARIEKPAKATIKEGQSNEKKPTVMERVGDGLCNLFRKKSDKREQQDVTKCAEEDEKQPNVKDNTSKNLDGRF